MEGIVNWKLCQPFARQGKGESERAVASRGEVTASTEERGRRGDSSSSDVAVLIYSGHTRKGEDMSVGHMRRTDEVDQSSQ